MANPEHIGAQPEASAAVRPVAKINVRELLRRDEVQCAQDNERDGPRYCGSRRALVGAGIVPPDAQFPGEAPGVRGPRFTDAEGRAWQITWFRKEYQLLQVRPFLPFVELTRRSQERQRRRQAQWARESELRKIERRLESMPTDRAAAQVRLQEEVGYHLQAIKKAALDPTGELARIGITIDAETRDEIKELLEEVFFVVRQARIRFDPTVRRIIEGRQTELRTENARADADFQGVLERLLGGDRVTELGSAA
jgi:hypothetical protein